MRRSPTHADVSRSLCPYGYDVYRRILLSADISILDFRSDCAFAFRYAVLHLSVEADREVEDVYVLV